MTIRVLSDGWEPEKKTVVLAISKRLRDDLNKREGYRAFLTREGDYYVPFRKRLKIAREYQADLFLSVHADAEKTRTAAGSSVYSLSLKSASSEAARILARNENLADIIGGEANGDAPKEGTDPILLNMFQTNTLNSSKILGNMLLTNLGTVSRIKFATVQEAPLMVLKLPEVPSVLIETAYISNRREEKLLRSPKFQKEVAGAIADAAVEFLSEGPKEPPPVILTKKEDVPTPPEKENISDRKPASQDGDVATAPVKRKTVEIVYRVKKGDSLGKIAQKYGTTVSAIAKLNDVRVGKALYVNRKLRVIVPVEEDTPPTAKADETAKVRAVSEKAKKRTVSGKGKAEGYKLYTVKKGESLDGIASKNGTTLAVLLKINEMKMKDKLLAGSKIKIPAQDAAENAKPEEKKGKGRAEEDTAQTAGTASEKAVKKGGKDKGKTGEEKSGYRLHTVKKGESLDGIAAKNGTTLAVLLKMNKMKPKDKLLAGRKIKVPAAEEAEDAKPEMKKGKERAEEDTPRTAGADEKASGKAVSEKTKKKGDKAKGKAEEEKTGYQLYTVKSGESLDSIATKNGTTLAVLLKLNRMKMKDQLLAGRKIKIPASDAAEDVKADVKKVKKGPDRKQSSTKAAKPAKTAKTYYMVKKGDTLDIIARKHRTTVAALKKMNGTKKLSPLHADQKLAIPARQ